METERRGANRREADQDTMAEYLKEFGAMAEKIAETTAKLVAHDVVEKALPTIEASFEQAFTDLKEGLVLQITGEDWEDRAEIRLAIQWAIRQRRKTRLIEKGIFLMIGTGLGAFIFKISCMTPPGVKP